MRTATKLITLMGGGRGDPYASLAIGLVLALNMDETTGTRYDASGNSNDATVEGTVGYGAGIVSNAAKVASNTPANYMHILTPSNIPDDTDWTISIWVDVGTISASWRIAAVMGDTETEDYTWILVNTGNTHYWYLATKPGPKVVYSTVAINEAGLHNIQAWYDKANEKIGISVDGENPVYTTGVTSVSSASYPIYMFRASKTSMGDGLANNSMIDRLYIWNRLLTVQERALDYNLGAPRQFPF